MMPIVGQSATKVRLLILGHGPTFKEQPPNHLGQCPSMPIRRAPLTLNCELLSHEIGSPSRAPPLVFILILMDSVCCRAGW
jgi:hypothetical protein